MKFEKKEEFAERWLDAALEQYGAAESPPGLESRLIAATSEGVRARRPVRTFGWLAAAAAVVIGAILLNGLPHRKGAPVVASSHTPAVSAGRIVSASAAPLVATNSQVGNRRPRRAASLRAANSASPRREHFPTPAPLSESERLLVLYVTTTPPDELAYQAKLQQELAKESERFEEKTNEQDN